MLDMATWLRRDKPMEYIETLYSSLPGYLSDGYLDSILGSRGNIVANGAVFNADVDWSPYLTVADGIRRTCGQPDAADQAIYVLGPSYVFGLGSEDAHTITSFLQENINLAEFEKKYIVHNFGTRGVELYNYYLHIRVLDLKPGDAVYAIVLQAGLADLMKDHFDVIHRICQSKQVRFKVFIFPAIHRIVKPSLHELIIESHNTEQLANKDIQPALFKKHPASYVEPPIIQGLAKMGVEAYDFMPLFSRPHEHGEMYFDKSHITYKGNKIMADYIFSIFQRDRLNPPLEKTEPIGNGWETLEKKVENEAILYLAGLVSHYYKKEGIAEWVEGIKKQHGFNSEGGRVGAIVMNANPFTLGHLYLVETALKEVDALYLFVVQQDASDFPFPTRLELVKQGTAHLKNVRVLPSGNFIISSFSFPGYFSKETVKHNADSSLDVLIFGAIVAPGLGITDRFLGEEPSCQVTSSYNKNLLKYLPPLGVDVRVIPRKTEESRVISASIVRQCLQDGDFKSIAALVPESTLHYLKTNHLNHGG